MNSALNIPEHMKEIRQADIPELARRAAKEANPFYPVPVFFEREQLEAILKQAACEGDGRSGALDRGQHALS